MADEVELNAKQDFMDFLIPKEQNIYEFKTVPEGDFRMEASAHDIEMKQLENTTGLNVVLAGFKGGVRK
jgi:hypothetical protein